MGRIIKKKQNRIIAYVLIIATVGGLIYAYEGGYFNPAQVTLPRNSYNIGNTEASSSPYVTASGNEAYLTKINVSSSCRVYLYRTYASKSNSTLAKFVIYNDQNISGNHTPYLLKYKSSPFSISSQLKWYSVSCSSYSLTPGIYWIGYIPQSGVKQQLKHVQGNPHYIYFSTNSYQNPYQICGPITGWQSAWACNYITVY